jgi:tetratricopeptide (TPR) repeat protein
VYQKELEVEHDNLRASLDWSVDHNVEEGLRLASALAWFWDMGGHWKEGLELLRALLDKVQPTAKPLLHAQAFFAAGLLSVSLGELVAGRGYLEHAVRITRDQGPKAKRLLALALCLLSRRWRDEDSSMAQSLFEEGWTIAQELADQWLIARMLFERGNALLGRRDYETARASIQESASLFHTVGDRRWESLASYYRARVDYSLRDYAAARLGFEEGMPFCYDTNDRVGIWTRLNGLGEVARSKCNYGLARDYHSQGYALANEMGRKSSICTSATNLGAILLRGGDLAESRRLFGEALRLDREMKQGLLYELWGFAWIAAVQNQMTRATLLLAVAKFLQTEGDVIKLNPADEADYDYYLNMIRTQLDEPSFDAAWEVGRAMSLEQAVEYALRESDA